MVHKGTHQDESRCGFWLVRLETYFSLSLTCMFQLFYTKHVFVDAFKLRKETLKSLYSFQKKKEWTKIKIQRNGYAFPFHSSKALL